jgi:hypothetical protein
MYRAEYKKWASDLYCGMTQYLQIEMAVRGE